MENRKNQLLTKLILHGVTEKTILDAFSAVPREEFVDKELEHIAYADQALPIDEKQTISQPSLVALMVQIARAAGAEKVLEVGAGSGYAAAILGQMAKEVYAVERHRSLYRVARDHIKKLSYDNVKILNGDGSKGLPEEAPFDAIIVSAAGEKIPGALLQQLKIGGRLVIPIGSKTRQNLISVTRTEEDEYKREALHEVQFVPLVSSDGTSNGNGVGSHNDKVESSSALLKKVSSGSEYSLPVLLKEAIEPFTSIEDLDLEPLLERVGNARVVLLGESTHGTSEFYKMRSRITRELVVRKEFNTIAIEADWPDAFHVNQYIKQRPPKGIPERPFTRFPTWVWQNKEVLEIIEWLRNHNEERPNAAVGIYGLDLYSLYHSIEAVILYLEKCDLQAAGVARRRYACLAPWEKNLSAYSRAAISGKYRSCENEVVSMLQELLKQRFTYERENGEDFLDLIQNAKVIANAEQYYRMMYYSSRGSWNLRDQHMFEVLKLLLEEHQPDSKVIVWAHNSHVGNAAATELAEQGETNLGELCKKQYGTDVYSLGFGTDRGTVAAASEWGGPVQLKKIRPSHHQSYERVMHDTGIEAFLLPLKAPLRKDVREELKVSRLERAIGVIYKPETEMESHYFRAKLPQQFDEYIWFDTTNAVNALSSIQVDGPFTTFPF